jgi:prepilin-type N-terminal cleavage/methylation domain-containing protein
MDTMRAIGKGAGFTLVELLTVIGIITILAAILTPIVGNAVGDAKRLRASKHLQQVAMAYVNFSLNSSTKELNLCNNATQWAGVLAKHGQLNVASPLIFSDDYLVEAEKRPTPKTIGVMRNGQWQINPEFENFPLSVVVIVGISSRAQSATTPIAYTRGLDNERGTWRSASGDGGGIYGESGGFIVFLDGHVEFCTNLADPQHALTNFYTGERTAKISEAVNAGARALSWKGVEWEANGEPLRRARR